MASFVYVCPRRNGEGRLTARTDALGKNNVRVVSSLSTEEQHMYVSFYYVFCHIMSTYYVYQPIRTYMLKDTIDSNPCSCVVRASAAARRRKKETD